MAEKMLAKHADRLRHIEYRQENPASLYEGSKYYERKE